MGSIIVRQELQQQQQVEQLCRAVAKEKWSVVIPAAGVGSRLGYTQPKILYPILGKPIAAWLCEIVADLCQEVVFVVSPQGQKAVAACLDSLAINYKIALQITPNGMAKAVRSGVEQAVSDNIVVLWGDQVTASRETIRLCQALHQQSEQRLLTLPTIVKQQPYIHLQRDANNHIAKVLERRETSEMPTAGENDCGIFLFNKRFLVEVLDSAFSSLDAIGESTREYNLLPLLPKFEVSKESVITLRIDDLMQTLGVNTQQDAEQVAQYLVQNRLDS